jgi:rod shape-determining protein MreD
MTAVVMALLLLAGALLQVLGPAPALLGGGKVPALLAVVLYYALHRGPSTVMAAAFAAGLLQDLLSPMPLGYSCAVFGLVAWLGSRFRSLVLTESMLTAAFFGLVGGLLATLAQAVLLARAGLLGWPLERVLMRAAGAGVLAAIVTPPVFRLAQRLDRWVGNVQVRDVLDDLEQPFGE